MNIKNPQTTEIFYFAQAPLWRRLANMNSTQVEQIYTTADVVVCGRPL